MNNITYNLLESLILEAPDNMSSEKLKEWNKKQMEIWIKLSNEKKVKFDDMSIFIKFATFFDSNYKKTHKFASYTQTEKIFLTQLKKH